MTSLAPTLPHTAHKRDPSSTNNRTDQLSSNPITPISTTPNRKHTTSNLDKPQTTTLCPTKSNPCDPTPTQRPRRSSTVNTATRRTTNTTMATEGAWPGSSPPVGTLSITLNRLSLVRPRPRPRPRRPQTTLPYDLLTCSLHAHACVHVHARSLPQEIRQPLPPRSHVIRHDDLCPIHVQRFRPWRLRPQRRPRPGHRLWRSSPVVGGHVGVC